MMHLYRCSITSSNVQTGVLFADHAQDISNLSVMPLRRVSLLFVLNIVAAEWSVIMKRINFASGAPLEEKVGYSRMVKLGDYLAVGGTTSVQPDGTVYGENDAYAQTKYVLEKQVHLLEKAGASAKDVFRIKIYTTNIKAGGDICRAYSEIFHDIRPLCTVVGTPALNRPTQIVEIEMEAMIGSEIEA